MKNIIIILLSAIMFSCGTGDRQKQPSASGKAGELLLVMDNNYWKGEAGDSFKSVFAAAFPMFPQPEPLFTIIQLENKAFTKLFESHRHIFIAEIDPSVPKAKIESGKNLWAYPQMVIKIIAPDIETFKKTIVANSQTFIDYYLKAEFERNINANKQNANDVIINQLAENFGIKMIVPQGFYVAKQTDKFMWLRRTGTKEDLDMSILVSLFPYINTESDFAPKTIWTRRDSITKQHIPGQFEGTYMTTYPDISPLFKEINFNGRFAVEATGLWRVEGDHMGGPSYNYTMVDDNGKFLINIDAYVYYPNKDKRNFMRQLQSIIYSLEFVN
jgi:hypothetical protein